MQAYFLDGKPCTANFVDEIFSAHASELLTTADISFLYLHFYCSSCETDGGMEDAVVPNVPCPCSDLRVAEFYSSATTTTQPRTRKAFPPPDLFRRNLESVD